MLKKVIISSIVFNILIPLSLFAQLEWSFTDTTVKKVVLNNITHSDRNIDVFFLSTDIEKRFGDSYYLDIDSVRYKNKSIGYIVEDLDPKCKLIDWNFPARKRNFLGLKRGDYEIFEIYLKNSDTTAIIINGYLDYKIYLPSDDKEAFEALLKQKKYKLTFFKVNINKWYTEIRNDLQKKDSYNRTILKGDKLYWEQNGLEIHEEYKVFKRAYPNIVKDE
jgi:hypothetical protein